MPFAQTLTFTPGAVPLAGRTGAPIGPAHRHDSRLGAVRVHPRTRTVRALATALVVTPGNFVADGARPRQPSLAFVPGWLVCWRDSSNWRNVRADPLRRGTRSVSGDDYTPRYHPAQAERAASEILPVIVLLHSYSPCSPVGNISRLPCGRCDQCDWYEVSVLHR